MTTKGSTAKRLRRIDLDAIRLESGSHEAESKQFCVMELAAYIARESWSDHPACVSPAIGAFLRSWNDLVDDDFRQRLKPFALRVIGTNTGPADEETRAWLATDWLVRSMVPAWLDLAGLTERAAELRALQPLTSADIAVAAQDVIERARSDATAAWAAARAAARDAARNAAGDAAWNAAWNAARAAAWNAAWNAARDAAWNAARDAAWDAARAAAGAAVRAGAKARLAPTVALLQDSAFGLLDAMIAVGQQDGAA